MIKKLSGSDVTDNALQNLLKDKKYCMAELCRMRESWGYKKTFTQDCIYASRRVMTGMLLYAPEEIHDIIYTHMDELARREILCLFAERGL